MNPNIRIMGRTSSPEHWENGVPLFWSASGALMKVKASELTFVLFAAFEGKEHWVRVELDGATMIRTPLNQGENRITVFRGIDANTEHTVQLFREVQCMSPDEEPFEGNCLLLKDVEIQGEFLPMEPVTRRIECIGDSLTSGEGLAGAKDFMDWVSCMFSTEGNYSQHLARALNADLHVISKSGWGVYQSWDERTECGIPLYYDKVCGMIKGSTAQAFGALDEANFTWQPDAVIINLGTNDGSAYGKTADKEAFEAGLKNAVTGFLKKLRGHYPNAQLLWAYGMCGYAIEPQLKAAVEAYCAETGDTKAHYVSLPSATDEEMGSRQHPGKLNHKKAADTLLEKLKELL